jgi:hypothetical protein
MTYSHVCKILPVLIGLVSFTCRDEDLGTRSYPSIDTKPITAVNESGANFNAVILSTGNAGISDHGFVYDDASNPDLDNSDHISLGETSQKGSFSAFANRNLIKDKRYYVKAYATAKNNNLVVYGQQVEFVSRGGRAPEIKDFIPKEGVIGDTIMIIGTGFSDISANNIVRFGQEASSVIKVTGDKLWCIVPPTTNVGEDALSLTVGGHKIIASANFNLKAVSITSIDQEWVSFGDVVILNVENLPKLTSLIDVNLLGIKSEIFSHSLSELKVKVSHEVTTLTQPVIIKVGSQRIESKLILKLKAPLINSFEPKEGKKGQLITIYGDNFNTIKEKQQVKFGSYPVEILSVNRDNLTVRLTDGLIDQMVNIEVYVSGQMVKSSEQFHLLSPWRKISDFPGNAMSEGAAWAACGYGYITFGESWKYEPTLDVWEQIASYPLNPLYQQVSFSANCNGYVGAGGTISGSSFQKFYEYSAESDTWNIKSYFPSPPIDIRYDAVGWNLNGYGYVAFGTWGRNGTARRETLKYDHVSNSWTYVKPYPGEFPPDYWTIHSTGFVVNGEGYALILNLGENENYFWKYSPSLNDWFQLPNFPGNAKYSPTSFAVDGSGYIIGGSKGIEWLREVWKFDSDLGGWLPVEDFPGAGRDSPVTFTIGNKAYYGVGLDKNGQLLRDFWEFDPSKL